MPICALTYLLAGVDRRCGFKFSKQESAVGGRCLLDKKSKKKQPVVKKYQYSWLQGPGRISPMDLYDGLSVILETRIIQFRGIFVNNFIKNSCPQFSLFCLSKISIMFDLQN